MSIVTVPVTDVRRSLSDVLAKLDRPVFLTQHGRVKAVLLDIEAYNDLLDELDDARLAADPEFQASMAAAKAHQTIPLEDALKEYGL